VKHKELEPEELVVAIAKPYARLFRTLILLFRPSSGPLEIR